MRIAILENDPLAPPGRILDLLDEWKTNWKIVQRHRGDPLPSPEDFQGYILFGREPSLLSPTSWLEEEIPFLKGLLLNPEIPILGICLGAQLLALALGGKILRGPAPEIEIRLSYSSPSPPAKKILKGLPLQIPFLQWHQDRFLTPPRALCVLRSKKDGAHDGFLFGRVLAIQGHLEVTAGILKRWVEETPTAPRTLLKEFEEKEPLLIASLRILLQNLLFTQEGSSASSGIGSSHGRGD
jgi:GMP synthase-like glutamine amidotransferase